MSLFTPYLNVRVRLMMKAKVGQAIACNPIRHIWCPAEGSEEPPPIMKSLGQLMLLMCEKEMSVNEASLGKYRRQMRERERVVLIDAVMQSDLNAKHRVAHERPM